MPHPAAPQELAALELRLGANLEGLAGKERGKGIQDWGSDKVHAGGAREGSGSWRNEARL